MDRRSFLHSITSYIAILPGLAFIQACTRMRGSSDVSAEKKPQRYIELQDLMVMRLDGPSPAKPVDILPAKNILSGKRTYLYWTEKDHEHVYEFGPLEFEKLKRGEVAIVTSSVEEDHTHQFMVNPKVPFVSSDSILIPLQAFGDPKGDAPPTPDKLNR